jgi:hypothetical protein
MSVAYHVVVVFDCDDEGDLKAGEAREATNALAAERAARSLSRGRTILLQGVWRRGNGCAVRRRRSECIERVTGPI